MTGDRDWMRGIVVALLLLAGFAAKGVLVAPPPAPATAAAGQFDGDRALARLRRVLGDERPHPVDTPADDAVRGRLIAELRAIGLEPRVQEIENCSGFPKTRVVSCDRVHNVIATVPGRAPGPHLLINAHYDSTATGPGASDDGLGVATMLELASILKAAPPPRPVTLLFNEGEEFGLNGAAAFVQHDPEAQQVNSLVNIDTRGDSGPAVMYETSDPNGAAIAAYARSTSRPYANSLSTDFAKLIPNTTDVVFFKPRGWTLLNYGIIGNETRYHSPGDTVAALSRASLNHVGNEVLAATRTLASLPDPKKAGSNRMVFTDVAGRAFIHMTLLAAAALLTLLLAAATFLAWRRGALGRPLLVTAMAVVGGTAAAGVAGTAAGLVRAGDYWRAYPLIAYLAVYALLLLVMVAVLARFGRGIGRERLRAAAWLLILLIGAAATLVLPGASIFFLIAPAIALLAIALTSSSPGVTGPLAWAATIVQFVMFAELLALIEMLLVDGPLWAVAPLAALAALPALIEMDPARLRPALAVLLIGTIGLWAAAFAMPRASADRPLGFSIDYFRNVPGGTAYWAVASNQAPLPSGYPGKWHKAVLPYNGRPRWVSQAPLLATPVGSARVIASEPAGDGRRVRIALTRGGADTVSLRFPEDTKLLAAGLAGELVPIAPRPEPSKPLLRCTGRSCDNLVIEAVFADRDPVTAEIFSTRFAFPVAGQALVAARPRTAIPQYSPNATITRSRVTL
ncbi:MAG: M20/M25/M40 family metallo-hydrolase [Sphingomonas sp.]